MTAGRAPPWLSVIVPTYNGAAYLEESLESVRREGVDGIEVVAADDGSTDATLRILEAHRARLTLRILGRARVGNWVASTNHALREATGRYACFLHQDDVWLPGRVAAVRRLLADPVTLAVPAATFIDARARELGPWSSPFPPGAGAVPSQDFVERLLVQNFVAIPGPVFDRAAALRVGGLDETLWYTADWDFWLKLAALGPVRVSPERLVGFRVHAESQTMARHRTREDFEEQLSTVLERHFAGWARTAPPRRAREVRAAAEFSNAVNAALAGGIRGQRVPWLALARSFARLGARGWLRYGRDSRILERVGARLAIRGR